MAKILEWFRLMRVRQWYKNLVIFLAIFFVGHLFKINELWLTFLGFVSLCFVSSANYIINDFIDLKEDRLHPEKKERTLAAGKVGKVKAMILGMLLLVISLLLAEYLGMYFFYAVIFLFALTQIYSFF